MKTLKQVINHLGKRFEVSEEEVLRFIFKHSMSDDFSADVMGYYGIDSDTNNN